MKVLITGAAGFIGSHLSDCFQADGHEVWGVDNFLTGPHASMPPLAAFSGLDIADRQGLYDLANRAQPDLVVHCAASYSDPDKWHRDTDTNVTGTINTTLVAKHHGARLVYFQTALPPISSYAISKIAGEQYIKLSGVPSLIFRLANIYGPRNLSGPIPTFYKRLSAGQPCTVVDTRRDLVYINDLVELVMTALGTNAAGKYDVCSGTDYSILEMYDRISDELKSEEYAELKPAGADDVLSMNLDWRSAFARFDWKASTPLAEGIRETVAWYQEHGVGETYSHLKVA